VSTAINGWRQRVEYDAINSSSSGREFPISHRLVSPMAEGGEMESETFMQWLSDLHGCVRLLQHGAAVFAEPLLTLAVAFPDTAGSGCTDPEMLA
jgi:hypothetical protein